MKDQYAGDVGDFGKYGLLRALCRGDSLGPDLRLGVIWYLTSNDPERGDGKYTKYLCDSKEEEYRSCDPHVYDRLRAIVHERRRSVASIEGDEVLPSDTLFYRASVPAKREHRKLWADSARRAMTAAQVVFVDPDNGLEGESPTTQHALFDELVPMCDGTRTIVIYQQQARMAGGRNVEIPWHVANVRERLPNAKHAFALRFARGTSRALIVVPGETQSGVMVERARALIDGYWGQHEHFDRKIYT